VVADVKLNRGINTLVFKAVGELAANWKGSVRFTDAAGQPVNGISVRLEP
jgi:hypothetical protein